MNNPMIPEPGNNRPDRSSSSYAGENPVTTDRLANEAPVDPVATAEMDNSTTSTPTVVQVAVNDLKPHPMNAAVYGNEAVDEELAASIKSLGVVAPLHATAEHVVVDGHRRLKAARAAGLATVPVIVLNSGHDALNVVELLLESNRTRSKNNEQRVREFMAYRHIEAERAKARQGQRTDLLPKSVGSQTTIPAGTARDIAAKKVGMAGSTADHGEAVVNVLDRLESKGDTDAVKHLREIFHKKKIETAYKEAINRGWIHVAKKPSYKLKAGNAGSEPAGKSSDLTGPSELQASTKTPSTPPKVSLEAATNVGDEDTSRRTKFRDFPLQDEIGNTVQSKSGDNDQSPSSANPASGSGDQEAVPTIYRDKQLSEGEGSPRQKSEDEQVDSWVVEFPATGAATPRCPTLSKESEISSKAVFSLADGTKVAADQWTNGWIDADRIIGMICDLERQCMSTTPEAMARCVRCQRLLIDLVGVLNYRVGSDLTIDYLEEIEDALGGIRNIVRTHPKYPRSVVISTTPKADR